MIVNPTNSAGVIVIDNIKTGRAKRSMIIHGLSRLGVTKEWSMSKPWSESMPSDGLGRRKVARKARGKSTNPKDIIWNTIGGWAEQMHSVGNEITKQQDTSFQDSNGR